MNKAEEQYVGNMVGLINRCGAEAQNFQEFVWFLDQRLYNINFVIYEPHLAILVDLRNHPFCWKTCHEDGGFTLQGFADHFGIFAEKAA